MNVVTASSISPRIRETDDLEMPVSLPRALTSSSTLRVETPFDPGGADHRVECLVDPAPGVQQGREERSLTQCGDRQVEVPGRGGQSLRARPVEARHTLLSAFVAASADLGASLGVDQVLQAGLQQAPKQFLVRERGIIEEFLQQARQGRLVVGHRGVLHMVLGGIRSHDDPPKNLQHPSRATTGITTTLRDSPIVFPVSYSVRSGRSSRPRVAAASCAYGGRSPAEARGLARLRGDGVSFDVRLHARGTVHRFVCPRRAV